MLFNLFFLLAHFVLHLVYQPLESFMQRMVFDPDMRTLVPPEVNIDLADELILLFRHGKQNIDYVITGEINFLKLLFNELPGIIRQIEVYTFHFNIHCWASSGVILSTNDRTMIV